jgi:vacuolar-type H+-ATPase subunit E/Vma4
MTTIYNDHPELLAQFTAEYKDKVVSCPGANVAPFLVIDVIRKVKDDNVTVSYLAEGQSNGHRLLLNQTLRAIHIHETI